jgi:hypothetical protein
MGIIEGILGIIITYLLLSKVVVIPGQENPEKEGNDK